jgi:hypothetical protein
MSDNFWWSFGIVFKISTDKRIMSQCYILTEQMRDFGWEGAIIGL